jgi:hypothetical protein
MSELKSLYFGCIEAVTYSLLLTILFYLMFLDFLSLRLKFDLIFSSLNWFDSQCTPYFRQVHSRVCISKFDQKGSYRKNGILKTLVVL